jgi:lipopolysaccharide exporter
MRQHVNRFLNDIKTDLYHSSLLLSGNLVAQIIGFLAYPVITRLFSASQFGEFSLFLSITGILAIISTGRLEYALVLPDEDKEANNLKKIGAWWCLIFSLLCALISFLLGLFGNYSKAIPGLYWVGLYVFASGIVQIFTFYKNREKQYKALAKISVLQSAAVSTTKIALGIAKVVRHGLIFGSIIGQLVAAIAISKDHIKKTFTGRPHLIKHTLQKYSAFPKYRMIQAIISSFSSNLPIFFITFYFSSKEAGYFALVLGIAFKVISLVTQALYQVLYRKFAELKNNGEPILPVFLKIVFLLFFTGSIPCFLIFMFVKPLVLVFFGPDWIEVAVYIRMMLPWLIFVFMAQPFAFIADVFSLQKQVLIIDIVHLLVRVLALYTGFWLSSVYLSVLLFSLISIIVLLFILFWYYFIIKISSQRVFIS